MAVALARQRSGGVGVRSGRYLVGGWRLSKSAIKKKVSFYAPGHICPFSLSMSQFFRSAADLLQLMMWKLMWSRKSSFFSCKNSTNLLGLMHISASYLISFETTVYSTLAATDLPLLFSLTVFFWLGQFCPRFLASIHQIVVPPPFLDLISQHCQSNSIDSPRIFIAPLLSPSRSPSDYPTPYQTIYS